MHYINLDSIDSTNNEAKRLISLKKLSEETCISAKTQTAGRGRQGKSFFSPDSGLYMTLVFPVDCSIESQVTMTTRTACAVAESLENCTGQCVGIKWVNDIYIRGKKCCGILCEAVNDYETGRMRYLIAGIGINIYTGEWPDDLKEIAGSLYDEKNPAGSLDLNEFTERLKKQISEKEKEWLFEKNREEFLKYYKDHSIVLGKKIQYFEEGTAKEATAVDIDENGGLIVCPYEVSEDRQGTTDCSISTGTRFITLSSGEISLRIH